MKAESKTNRPMRRLTASLVGLLILFIALLVFAFNAPDTGTEESLGRVRYFAEQGHIIDAKILDQDSQVVGRVCAAPLDPPGTQVEAPTAEPLSPLGRCRAGYQHFHVSYPRSDVATQELIDKISARAPLVVDKQPAKAVAKTVLTFLMPLLILANLFGIIFVSKTGESSVADVVGFGKISKKRQRPGKRTGRAVTFADVAGADEAVSELSEVIDYLRDPSRFEAYGAAPPKGVLLFGPPGCGKTLLARAVAGESGVPFFSLSGAEFVESLVGVGAARVRDLFQQVAVVAPAIVFIDEIDAVGRRREGEGMSGGEREQTVNQLLVEMDGFEVTSGIVVMAATNRPDILDPALLRPGRFDRHVTVHPPDIHGREKILALHARGKPMAEDVDFAALARRTPGFTGADLANVINEGALLAIREGGGREVTPSHLAEAVQRVLHGPQRRGRLMSSEERRRIAMHESGHALVAAALGHIGEVQRVSVVARGAGLGQSVLMDEADRVLHTKSEMEAELAIAMAGMAAEQLLFGEASTTVEADLERATELARRMVGLYGMSFDVAPLRLLSRSESALGESLSLKAMSGETMVLFDQEVKDLIRTGRERALAILSHNKGALEALGARLEMEETIEGAPLLQFLDPVRGRLPADYDQIRAQRPANNGALGPARARGARPPARN